MDQMEKIEKDTTPYTVIGLIAGALPAVYDGIVNGVSSQTVGKFVVGTAIGGMTGYVLERAGSGLSLEAKLGITAGVVSLTTAVMEITDDPITHDQIGFA